MTVWRIQWLNHVARRDYASADVVHQRDYPEEHQAERQRASLILGGTRAKDIVVYRVQEWV